MEKLDGETPFEGSCSSPTPMGQDRKPSTLDSQPDTAGAQLAACGAPRQSGGQPFNQNARKHGLYSRYLQPEQRVDYEEACLITGTGAEGALLRTKLAGLLAKDPENVLLVNKVINTIIRLEATRPAEKTENRGSERARRILKPWFTAEHPLEESPVGKMIAGMPECRKRE